MPAAVVKDGTGTPKFRQGKISPPFLTAKFSPRNSPLAKSPPPLVRSAQPRGADPLGFDADSPPQYLLAEGPRGGGGPGGAMGGGGSWGAHWGGGVPGGAIWGGGAGGGVHAVPPGPSVG